MRYIPRIRFSLRTLLVAAPILSALTAWTVQRVMRHKYETVAVIQVHRSAASLFWARQTPGAAAGRENLVHQTSDEVLTAAIGSLRRSSRDWIDRRGDPIPWLRRHLRINFIGKSTLVTIALNDDSLRRSDPTAQMETVNAVAEACCEFSPDDVQIVRRAMIVR
jgi:hypothetical protein